MIGARAFALIAAADVAFGDPRWFPHPVRAIGALCGVAERAARGFARGDAARERFAGGVLCLALVGGTYASAARALALARRKDARLGFALEIVIGWTTLAARDLLAEAYAVLAALEANDLPRARRQLARIVGRDTAALDVSEIARATIETLAESACDGIVAPLLALALGGVPLALAFKTVNTLDSMIGHIEAPYTHLGWAAARLDDVACYVPARVTAFVLASCAPFARGDAARAFATLRADGHRHRSPNAGRPEAAMAGALGVRLGGTNVYDGIPHVGEYFGASFAPPTAANVRDAARLVAVAVGTLAASALGLLGLRDGYQRSGRET